MKKSRANTTLNHKDFVNNFKKLLELYDLKINSATFSSIRDSDNVPLVTFSTDIYVVSNGERTYHEH